MKPRLTTAQLKRLRSVMQHMLSAAASADWEELSRLDQQRRVILDYPAQNRHADTAPSGIQAISSGGRPLPLQPRQANADMTRDDPHASEQESHVSHALHDRQHQALVEEVMTLDADIKSQIEQARQSLLQESRQVKAQIKARNGYVQTRKTTLHVQS